MGYQLRMSAEIAEWLGDLRESDPVTATEVGAALLALMDAVDAASMPFVTAINDTVTDDARERLDVSYQQMLEVLQRLRRQGAEAATRRRRLELRLGELPTAELSQPALAILERKLAAAQRREDVLSALHLRVQAAVDAFRTSKETAKAMVTAAEAQRGLHDAFLAAGISDEDGPAEPHGREIAVEADHALAAADRALDSAMAAFAAAGLSVPASQRVHPDAGGREILELHADPLGTDVLILFAVDPPGTATLLAVLEGEAAISEHRERAIGLAADLLTEIREHGWSADPAAEGPGGPEFTESAAFLYEWFPAQREAVEQRAATLAGAVSPRDLRGDRDLAEMSRLTGTFEDRLRRIDRNGLQAASVRDAAAYVRALGGRLELTAIIDGESRTLVPTPGT